jgi:hypothetical protein
MKDIDRNINSPLYEVSKISHITDISSEITVNFKNVYTAQVNGAASYSVELQPGEYYFRHVLRPVEANNSMFFVILCGNSSAYPIYSYYAQSPLANTVGETVIPHHFIVDKPIELRIYIWNINEQTSTIKGTIQIKKRVQ